MANRPGDEEKSRRKRRRRSSAKRELTDFRLSLAVVSCPALSEPAEDSPLSAASQLNGEAGPRTRKKSSTCFLCQSRDPKVDSNRLAQDLGLASRSMCSSCSFLQGDVVCA
jgi:hypothetical protein